MKSWHQLFTRPENSGVYSAGRKSLPAIRKAATNAGLTVFRIDAVAVTGKQEFLDAANKALRFPDYFGSNWDAFEDCMTDLSWHKADGFVVLLEHWDRFADNAQAEMNVARNIFQDASQYWKEQGIPFFVVLMESGESRTHTRS